MLADWTYRLVDDEHEIAAAGFIDLYRLWQADPQGIDALRAVHAESGPYREWRGRLFSVDVSQAPPRFISVGADLASLFGDGLAGRPIDEETIGVSHRRMAFMYAEARVTGKVALASGLRTGAGIGLQVYSVIHLPLRDAGGKVATILGAFILGAVVVAGGT